MLRHRVQDTSVFARTSPQYELRLVMALQAEGAVVAMTGDGVNDAPALKRADVGVAMGRNGSEAAKEASEAVLADDSFATIAEAVRAGRTVYDNLKKAIVFLLPVNGGESFAIIAAIVFGYTLPITPLQILWVTMVSSVGLALALAFEPTEADVMRRPPRPANESVLSAFLVWRIVFVSALFIMATFFDTRPVDLVHWAEIIGVGISLFAVLEIEKWLWARITGRARALTEAGRPPAEEGRLQGGEATDVGGGIALGSPLRPLNGTGVRGAARRARA